MTAPNLPSQADILAAHDLMKTWLPPSFANDIDAGKLDGFGLYNRAMAQLIRQRTTEDAGE
jgi:hypothetical protein